MKSALPTVAAGIALVLALINGAWFIVGLALTFLVARFAWHRLVSVRLWPNRACFWCKGTGRNFGSNSDRWGPCWFGCDKGSRPRAMSGGSHG